MVLSFLTVPAVINVAEAANPACSPTAGSVGGAGRHYIFTNAATCDWTIPDGWSSFTIEVIGGGGGGGGGSWAGTIGGGGGGGGIGGRTRKTYSVTVGTSVAVTVGSAGAAGIGASTQGGTNGSNGGAGGLTKFAVSSSDSVTAAGGVGGQGGTSDTGGSGGLGEALIVDNVNYGGAAGGAQNSGNGGVGGLPLGYPTHATSTNPGYGGGNASYGNIYNANVGGGGARTGTDLASGYENRYGSGASSNYAARSSATNSGGGGGGGAGCSGASATCANRNGAAGAAGYIILYRNLTANIGGLNLLGGPSVNTASFAVGVAPTFPIFTVLGQLGTVSWTVNPSLPAGLSLNSATGVISGIPTQPTARTVYWLYATDYYGYASASGWDLIVNKGPGTAPTFNAVNIVYNVPTALSASGGSGAGAITYTTSSADCVLSGTRGETVTAQKASGNCTITAQKAGDSN